MKIIIGDSTKSYPAGHKLSRAFTARHAIVAEVVKKNPNQSCSYQSVKYMYHCFSLVYMSF